jgi:hypothetical protein
MARTRHEGGTHERRTYERGTDEHATEGENGTENEAPVPAALTPSQLHQLLAAYFAALAALKAPPPPPQVAGLNALLYWQEYFANPDHLFPQDEEHRFVRGRIWS